MKHTQNSKESPVAICVAGGGANLDTASIAFNLINSEFEDRGVKCINVHGIEGDRRSQRVRPASEQLNVISQIIEGQDIARPIILVAQCLGTIAALDALHKFEPSTRRVALTTFSPALSSPAHTISQPKSTEKRFDNNTRMKIRDFTEGAIGDFSQIIESEAAIPEQYFDDIHEASSDFEERLKQSVILGSAAVFATEKDWNQDSPATVRRWIKEGGLPDGRVSVLKNTGHSLNLSGTSSSESKEWQLARCRDVVTASIECVS